MDSGPARRGTGVLDISELEERVEAAYAARTVRELQALVADLPAPPAPRPARPRRRPRVPGNRSFAERMAVSWPAIRDRTGADDLASLLVARGYTLVSDTDRLVVFEQDRLPAWTILVAVFAFPFGLLALTHKRRSRIVVAFTDEADGTEIAAYGGLRSACGAASPSSATNLVRPPNRGRVGDLTSHLTFCEHHYGAYPPGD